MSVLIPTSTVQIPTASRQTVAALFAQQAHGLRTAANNRRLVSGQTEAGLAEFAAMVERAAAIDAIAASIRVGA